VLFGRCEREPLASYQPFTEALRQWVAGASAAEAGAAGAPHAGALAALLPELAAKVGEPPGRGAQDRLGLYDAVAALLAGVGRTAPVLLLLDDLHAADLPTLALLRRLARARRPAGVLVLGTYRHAEPPPHPPFRELASELRLDGLADEILLGGLDEAATAALVKARSGRRPGAAQARALRDRTGGNPLFLRQLAQAGADGGSTGVADAIERHVRRLPERTRAALATASILGHDLDLAVLADVAGDARESVARELQPAIAAGLVAEGPDRRLTFAHPLVREGLYAGLGSDQRAALHHRAGLALEALRPDATQALAFHFLRTGLDRQKAIDYAAAAAEDAIRRLAWEDALDLLDQVLARLLPDEEQRRRALLRRRGVAWQSVFTQNLHPGLPVQIIADRQPGSGFEM
jgi:predicted ATPase